MSTSKNLTVSQLIEQLQDLESRGFGNKEVRTATDYRDRSHTLCFQPVQVVWDEMVEPWYSGMERHSSLGQTEGSRIVVALGKWNEE